MTSNTQRSLKYLRDKGCVAEVVERWIPGANIRKDLFGFIDILAIDPHYLTIGVQSCSYNHMAERRRKIVETHGELLNKLRNANWIIYIFGWHKVKGKWTVNVELCTKYSVPLP